MMVLPFALVTLALGALLMRRRRIALALWGLALLSLLWLCSICMPATRWR